MFPIVSSSAVFWFMRVQGILMSHALDCSFRYLFTCRCWPRERAFSSNWPGYIDSTNGFIDRFGDLFENFPLTLPLHVISISLGRERVWVFQCAGLCVCCIGTPQSQNRRAAIKDQIQVSLFWSPRDSLRCAVQPIGNWAAKRATRLEAWLCCCCCCYCCFTVVVLHCGFCCSQSEAHGNWCIQ